LAMTRLVKAKGDARLEPGRPDRTDQ
jgi:hypothetical protein